MNLLLSRILTYLNGSLVDDCYYRFCKFVVYNYLEFEDMSFDDVCLKSRIDKDKIINFCNLLGFKNFDEFKKSYENGDATFPVFIKPIQGSCSIQAQKIYD